MCLRMKPRRAKAKAKKGQPKKQTVWARIVRALRRLLGFPSPLGKRIRRLPWWADILTVITVAFSVAVSLYEARVSLVPVVEPDSVISSSWLDLPITVRNRSDLWDLKDVRFYCDMSEQQFESIGIPKEWGAYKFYRVRGLVEWVIQQPPTTIPPGNTTSFPCNIATNSTIQIDGIPLTMRLIHLSIRTEYSINLGLFRWHREAKSQTFTWQQLPGGGWQWLPG